MSDNGGVAAVLPPATSKKAWKFCRISASSNTDTFQSTLDLLLKDKPVQGVYWLPALDNEGQLSGMEI